MKISLPVFALVIAGCAASLGTPALLTDVQCQGFRTQCTKIILGCVYLSVQGRRTIIPGAEQTCPQVKFIPLSWPLFQWRA